MSDEEKVLADAVNEGIPAVSDPADDPGENPPEEVPVDEPSEEEVLPAAAEGEGNVVPEPPAYEPDYTYTVQGEKKVLDERFHPLVTDKDSEEYVRTLVQRAEGLDFVESARDKFKSQYEEINTAHTSLNRELDTLNHYIQSDNFKAFQNTLEIPDVMILKRAQEILQYQEMTPEQKAAYDRASQNEINNYTLNQQNEQLVSEKNQDLIDQRDREVMTELNQPEVAEVANAYDERVGKPGAFYDEVWNRGKFHAMVNKTNPTAKEVVDEVLQMVGGVGAQPQAPSQPQGQPNPAQASQGAPKPTQKPVIPRVEGSGASPARPVIKSLDQIRKIRQEKFG